MPEVSDIPLRVAEMPEVEGELALDALGKIGDQSAVKPLIRIPAKEPKNNNIASWDLRRPAITALGQW